MIEPQSEGRSRGDRLCRSLASLACNLVAFCVHYTVLTLQLMIRNDVSHGSSAARQGVRSRRGAPPAPP